jgi:hypothetical protein
MPTFQGPSPRRVTYFTLLENCNVLFSSLFMQPGTLWHGW